VADFTGTVVFTQVVASTAAVFTEAAASVIADVERYEDAVPGQPMTEIFLSANQKSDKIIGQS